MTTAAQAATTAEGSVKETIISMVISLAMALVAKSYVVEAFVIPTGSMAPTLLGQHMRFQSPESGYSWAVNPWILTRQDQAARVQWMGNQLGPQVTDPMSSSRFNQWFPGQQAAARTIGYTPPLAKMPARAGDRILVQKYLYEVSPPKRFDVVVFKNPTNATQNFIKRLIGLPDENIWLVDGDVFTRPAPAGKPAGEWTIARKPVRIQKNLWRQVFSSEYAPLNSIASGQNVNHFIPPWKGDNWDAGAKRTYATSSAEPTTLRWDTDNWPIWDWNPYNDVGNPQMDLHKRPKFPTSDIRLRAGVRAQRDGLTVAPVLASLGHEFRAVLEPGKARLQMRAATGAIAAEWTTLKEATFKGFTPGRVVNVEFWHVDQSLQLWIDGRRVLDAGYDWTPQQRLEHALGIPFDQIPGPGEPDWQKWLATPDNYLRARAGVRWEFAGSPLTLERVALDRDVFYQPAATHRGPARATHPESLVTLNHEQFFVCGDNSPSSDDARLWDRIDPWIEDQIDPTLGVVNRRLMMGKAFYVYFPSTSTALGAVPVPDFGRMRLIK